MTQQILEFDSLEALIRASQESSNWNNRESRTGDHDFTGTASFEDACTLALDGWGDGLAKMQMSLGAVTAQNTAIGSAPGYMLDVCGAYPHAAIAASGDAFCMIAPVPVSERARPILRLATSTALAATFAPYEVLYYGAGLVAVIDSLESHGFSVELQSLRCNMTTDDKHRLTIKTTLKRAGDALDLERMAFCLGHASYNRRVHFGVVEARCPESLWRSTYGRAAIPEAGVELDSDVCLLPGPLLFGAGAKELQSPEAAFAAMQPHVLSLLADRYSNFPALLFRPAA